MNVNTKKRKKMNIIKVYKSIRRTLIWNTKSKYANTSKNI